MMLANKLYVEILDLVERISILKFKEYFNVKKIHCENLIYNLELEDINSREQIYIQFKDFFMGLKIFYGPKSDEDLIRRIGNKAKNTKKLHSVVGEYLNLWGGSTKSSMAKNFPFLEEFFSQMTTPYKLTLNTLLSSDNGQGKSWLICWDNYHIILSVNLDFSPQLFNQLLATRKTHTYKNLKIFKGTTFELF